VSVSDGEGPDGWCIIDQYQCLPGEHTKNAGPSTLQMTMTNKGEKGNEQVQMLSLSIL
jgi:hypothetical protein